MVSCARLLIKGFLVVLTAASICFILAAAISSQKESYAIVVDAGSTGSRAFIFRFSLDNDGRRSITSIKGMKVMPGLSSFSKASAEDVVGYLLPTFIDAAVIIPKSCHKSTKVYIKGTAGFRLLPEEDQLYIWNCLHDGLQSNRKVPFVIEKENLGTIDGKFEAYYAVLASNYVAGSVDGDLLRVDGKAMVGALDMGGSSTQLIFHTGTEPGHPIQIADFWSHSWLNFGVEKVRERVWQSLIEEHEKSAITTDRYIEDTLDLETKTSTVVIENPCTFIGHEEGSSGSSEEYSFIGTGSAKKCVELIKKVIWPEGVCSNPPCAVDGIIHPPIGGEFYGMSVYYYGLDCIRYLGPKTLSWPNPSIDEIELATHDFCALEWSLVKENMIGKDKKHAFTKSSQLHNRCVEGLYMATLLEYGFGFDGSHRNITLALEVMGHEVEWTLGFAMAEVPLPPRNVVGRNESESRYLSLLDPLKSHFKNMGSLLLTIASHVFSSFNSFFVLFMNREPIAKEL